MEARVRVIVYSNDNVYDNLIISENIVGSYRQMENGPRCTRLRFSRRGVSSYLVSMYVYTLKRSDVYRRAALQALLKLSESTVRRHEVALVYIRLQMPKYQTLDYKWNERVTEMALERRELDHAMSWLSTLGGGFSALGETFEHCAEMAGKISVRQLQLAIRLGDPLLVARCKLWAALSLLQRGCLRVARNVVQEIYRLAVAEKDLRLQNMCKGIWAKLQYTWRINRKLQKS